MKKFIVLSTLALASTVSAADLSLTTPCDPCQAGKKFAVKAHVMGEDGPLVHTSVIFSYVVNGSAKTETKSTNGSGNAQLFLKSDAGKVPVCATAEGAADSLVVEVE